MILKRLALKNFMSHTSTDLSFNGTGLYLVNGNTGAGKSTLLEALHWCLFGTTLRISNVDSVMSDFNDKKDCSVTIHLEDHRNIVIDRTKKSMTTGSTTVSITIDGTTEEYNRVKDANARIVSVLGIDERMFKNTVVLGQGLNKFFADSRMVDEKERKKILETAICMDSYEAYREEAARKVAEYNTKIMAWVEKGQIIQGMINAHKETLVKCAESETIDKDERIKLQQSAIVRTQEILKEIDARIEEIIPEDNSLVEHIAKLQQTCKEITADLYKHGTAKQVFIHRKNKLDEIKENINFNSDCPMCFRSMGAAEYGVFQKHIEEEYATITHEIKELTDKLTAISIDKQNTDSAIAHYSAKRQQLQSKLGVYNSNKISGDYIIKSAEEEIAGLLTITNTPTDISKHIKEQIATLEGDYEDTGINVLDCRKMKEAYEFWVEAFSDTGMKNIMFNQVTPLFNVISNKYLNKFSDGHMKLTLGTTSITKGGDLRDKMSIAITVDGFTKCYENCSGGESRFIDLANMFTIRDLSLTVSKDLLKVIVADEPIDWIDAKGKDRIMGTLWEMAQDNLILVITHSEDLKDKFTDDMVINIVKTGKGSEVA